MYQLPLKGLIVVFDIYIFSMIAVFIIGHICIAFEHIIKINKATIALMMAVICWTLQFMRPGISDQENIDSLHHHIANISEILFFLVGALTIVETVNVHHGFQVVAEKIRTRSKRQFLWTVGLLTYFLTAVFGNLTTTIVMIAIVQKILNESEDRIIIGAAIVLAANAGGVWSPIGNITTTMLWIGGQLTPYYLIQSLSIPSLAAICTSLALLSLLLKGEFSNDTIHLETQKVEPLGKFIFVLGILSLMSVPLFKAITAQPPFMEMLFALSLLWLATDLVHQHFCNRNHLLIPNILPRIDLPSILFFLGILLTIEALGTAHILAAFAQFLQNLLGREDLIALFIGLISAVIDNIPLMAAAMSMYNLTTYPTDSHFWSLLAYAIGLGGSILLIGSPAGIVLMGKEPINFFWYFKKISFPALIGFLMGFSIFLLGNYLL